MLDKLEHKFDGKVQIVVENGNIILMEDGLIVCHTRNGITDFNLIWLAKIALNAQK